MRHRRFYVEQLERRNLLAAHLVQDINTQPDNIEPKNETTIGDQVFFSARKGLWVSDGTEQGTQLVVEAQLPKESRYASFGDKLVYSDFDFVHGHELWISDGTAEGTQVIKDINPGPVDSVASSDLVEFDGWMFFRVTEGETSSLWRTDGTSEGTTRIAGVPGVISSIREFRGELFLTLPDSHEEWTTSPWQLWKSDGTEAGTVKVANFEGRVEFLESTLDNLFLQQFQRFNPVSVWSTDGSSEGTVLVDSNAETRFTIWNDRFVFQKELTLQIFDSATNSAILLQQFDVGKLKLFRSDSNWIIAGTVPKGPEPARAVAAAATSHQVGRITLPIYYDLWRLNPGGSNAQVQLASNWTDGHFDGPAVPYFGPSMATPPAGVEVQELEPFGLVNLSDVVFVEDEGFYVTSPEQPMSIPDPMAFTSDSIDTSGRVTGVPAFQHTLNGAVFVADESLWITDGMESGTQPLIAWESSFMPTLLTAPFHDHVIFRVDRGNDGRTQLWRTDGTAEGTIKLADDSGAFVVAHRTEEAIYFSAGNDTIWVVDADFNVDRIGALPPESNHSIKIEVAMANDQLVISRPVLVCEVNCLWFVDVFAIDTKSSSATGNTERIAQIGPYATNQQAQSFIPWGDSLAFVAGDPENGREIWTTDGTSEGTRLAFRSSQGEESTVRRLWGFQDELIYEMGPTDYSTIVRTDGTTEGTEIIATGIVGEFNREMFISDDRIAFVAHNAGNRSRVWGSDGSSAATNSLDLFVTTDSKFRGYATFLKEHNRELYFAADVGDFETELWATDGTVENTRRVTSEDSAVRLLNPALSSFDNDFPLTQNVGSQGNPADHVQLGDEFFFIAETPQHGREIWRTDGTDAGTHLVVDISDGPDDSTPNHLTVIDDALYFAAIGDQGNEPWIYTEVPMAMPGDVDGNNEITFADFLILSMNFGKQDAGRADGDLDGNGEVDNLDVEIFTANFGQRRITA